MRHAMKGHPDGWVMVESSDKMWSTGERNGKPRQYSCLENPMNSMKRQKDRIQKDELLRSVLGLPPALPQVTNKKNDLDASSFSSPPVPRCSPQLCLPLSGKPLSSVAPVEPAPPLPSPCTALGLPPSHSTLVLSQSPSATLSLHLCSRQHSRTPLSADTPR